MSLDFELYEEIPEMPGSYKCVFTANIAANLRDMAWWAGLHTPLWEPVELNRERAEDITTDLEDGIKRMELEPTRYKLKDPGLGGGYETLLKFAKAVLEACLEYPKAKIEVSG